jgi:putative pyruvate formate lyase activating enzyme
MEMWRQVGDLAIVDGVATRGLLVRHLTMPNDVMGTGDVVRFLAREVSRDTYLNLMDQYRPCGDAARYPAISRPLTAREFDAALDTCRAEGLTRLDGQIRRRFRVSR